MSDKHSPSPARFWTLTLGSVGVVYGDIGTSPLYAFREAALHATHGRPITPFEIYGVLSLIIWALILIVTLKYVLFLLRTDNKGEGGTLALMALARKAKRRKFGFVFFCGLIGAALFYGDAAITPAISVLSAVEGLKLVTPAFDHMVLPLSLLILILLFVWQYKGTDKVSMLFGPVTVLWFLVMAGAGLIHVVQRPDIFHTLNPLYAIRFMAEHGKAGFIALGAVFLAVTGAEALYADLGHFGRRPIQTAWLFLVFPALILNYLGQGALVLSNPAAIENPFFLLVPDWTLPPLVLLATVATIIASQAVITGAFSLTRQAIQLGLLPRMEIRHTSFIHEGQIYIPQVNTLLLFGVLLLCVMFRTSSALAAAYGIAVTGTMVVTALLVFVVLWKVKKKNVLTAGLIVAPFLAIDLVFLFANSLKVFEGGMVPLLFAGGLVLAMSIWVAGTNYLFRRSRNETIAMAELVRQLTLHPPARTAGTAVFLTSDPDTAPFALLQNLKHNGVLHDHNLIATVVFSSAPKVDDRDRLTITPLADFLTLVKINFGFMEDPNIPKALAQAKSEGLDVDPDSLSYFLGRRTIIADAKSGLPLWQDKIYIAMAKTAANATDFYSIPPRQAVELGTQIAV